MRELGTLLGVTFTVDSYPSDGFQLTLGTYDEDTDNFEYVYDNRMIGYTLWEAVIHACHEVWREEIEQHNDYELPERIANSLNIEETYFDEDDE